MTVQVLLHDQPHEHIQVVVLLVVLDVQNIQISEHFFDVVYHLLSYYFDECRVQVESHAFVNKVELLAHHD